MFLSVLEKWLLPYHSVLSGRLSQGIDLTEEELDALPKFTSGCLICGHILPNACVCKKCRERPPAFDQTQIAFIYTGCITDLVKQFKFSLQRSHGRLLAEISQKRYRLDGVQNSFQFHCIQNAGGKKVSIQRSA